MKSLIEESSSIAKAIEKGWERAGKPQSFEIKVFELPEKNFLGITTKYAKIGIFFSDEKQNTHSSHKKEHSVHPVKQKRPERPTEAIPQKEQKNQPRTKQPARQSQTRERGQEKPSVEQQDTQSITPLPVEPTIVWSEEMIEFIINWLQKSLNIMDLGSLKFDTSASKNHLKIHFAGPLVQNSSKQTQFFRGLSYLVMASIRAKFKTDLKGLRVMFSCE